MAIGEYTRLDGRPFLLFQFGAQYKQPLESVYIIIIGARRKWSSEYARRLSDDII